VLVRAGWCWGIVSDRAGCGSPGFLDGSNTNVFALIIELGFRWENAIITSTALPLTIATAACEPEYQKSHITEPAADFAPANEDVKSNSVYSTH
jgi:hypothetical protein